MPSAPRLIMRYGSAGALYELHLPIAPINPVPVGPANDYHYSGDGPKVPGDVGVLATFHGFAHVWAPYYDWTWLLSLAAVWYDDGSGSAQLPITPTAPTEGGTNPSPVLTDPPLKRGFTFYSALGARQIVRLLQVPINRANNRRMVTASAGGFDERDRALVAYLSGVETGLVCWDGQPYPPSATVWTRSQNVQQATPESACVGDYIMNG